MAWKTGIKNYKTTKLQNYKTSNGGAFGNKLWSVNGCFYCSDCLGSNVCDITLGDPWGILEEKNNPGENLIFMWNDKFLNIIDNNNFNFKKVEQDKVIKSLNFDSIKEKEKEKNYRLSNKKSFKFILLKQRRKLIESCKMKFDKNSMINKIINRLPKVKL